MDIIGDDLVGTLHTPLTADLHQGETAVGVRFRPGAFTALYGVPASELIGQRVRLSEVVRPRPLRVLAADAPEPDWVAALALRAPSVRWLARETGYSERHLRRRVYAATGHTPKRLARIARMQDLLSSAGSHGWAHLAAQHGYHDESHMINDVRALAGASPAELFDGRFLQDADADK